MTGKIVRALAALYLVLLAASWIVRHAQPERPVPAGLATVDVPIVAGDRPQAGTLRIAYRDAGPRDRPAVILLHGSPGGSYDFDNVLPALAKEYRVIAPDLPGFGASERRIPDYSFRAHARYVLELMDALRIGEAHLVGFSMGGGVVLSMADIAPRRVRSITMLSAIGAQEYELLGDYRMNHALHGIQLALIWSLRELTPHFGALDHSLFGVSYARNFYDSDQRPLRGILSRFAAPMLIIHGKEDPLVPIQAAEEHARLVPQARIVMTPASHFMVFVRQDNRLPGVVLPFLESVERGDAPTRATADPERIAAAARPFDPRSLPKFKGIPRLIVLALISASTLVSEDLSSIGAGLLIAAGRLSFLAGTVASLLGILIGDILLFLIGRTLGRAVVARAPMRWFITPHQMERSSEWFRERGPMVILASRFLPGTRFTTYLASGVLRTPFWTFMLWFGVAAILWTPLLVGVTVLVGAPVLDVFDRFEAYALPAVVVVFVIVTIATRTIPKLFTWRGRRLLASGWRRLVRWEYWPPYVFYPPVVLYAAWLGVRLRGMTLFTAANPAIEAGGFIGESKAQILTGLARAGDTVAPWHLVRGGDAEGVRDLGLPLVLKPDAGQRGSGVVIAKSWDEVDAYLRTAPYDVIAQQYAPGVEFGVFYVRRPSEDRGRIFAITEKELPAVTGDGARTLEELILTDRRTLPMAPTYLDKQHEHLHDVVPSGERVQLVELGTHCRGAFFRDGMRHATPELEAAIDRVSRTFDGFCFGRYDVRSPSVEAFRRGELKVIELNGVTSEATSVYDAAKGPFDAYAILFRQWRLAYEIGAENRARGAPTTGLLQLVRMIGRYRAAAARHVDV
ncbi:MAG TPA: alpha/beta fold hydrolase [Candidatus Polarisedimenticolaceae bacterium]|nr:alpha/beta fold hydrolase [Candidatus Polarisedimenticolaceae bacterium]